MELGHDNKDTRTGHRNKDTRMGHRFVLRIMEREKDRELGLLEKCYVVFFLENFFLMVMMALVFDFV